MGDLMLKDEVVAICVRTLSEPRRVAGLGG
jgi:hypothetical protein